MLVTNHLGSICSISSSGRIPSSCAYPCTSTWVETKFEYSQTLETSTDNSNLLILTFIPIVQRSFTRWKVRETQLTKEVFQPINI